MNKSPANLALCLQPLVVFNIMLKLMEQATNFLHNSDSHRAVTQILYQQSFSTCLEGDQNTAQAQNGTDN